MKRLDALDILKYVACLFVIMLHMDLPQVTEAILQPLLRTAVPLFFMITGFFYDQTVKAGKVEKQLRKVAVLTLAANGVHVGWCCFKCLVGVESLTAFFAEVIQPASLVNWLVFNQPVWRTSIWYINALLVVLLLFYAVRKSEDYRRFYPLIPLLLGMNLLLGTYAFVLPVNEMPLLCYSRNFLFCGVPYFLLGHYVFQNRKRACRLFGTWQSTVVFWMAGCLELWLLDRSDHLYYQDHLLTSAFLALALFCICVKQEEACVSPLGKVLARWGKEHSFVIYVTHSIFIEILYKIVRKADGYVSFAAEVFAWVGPLLVLVLSTFSAHMFARLKERKRPAGTS